MRTPQQTTHAECASAIRKSKYCSFRSEDSKPINLVDTLMQAAFHVDDIQRHHVQDRETAERVARHPRVVGIVEKRVGFDVIIVNAKDGPPYRLSSSFDVIEWSHVKVFCKKRNRTFLYEIKGATVSECRNGSVRKRYSFADGTQVKLKHQTCIASNAPICAHCRKNTHLECLNSASYFVLGEATN